MSNFALSVLRKVKTPNRGTPQSAGLDFYIPEDLTVGELEKCYSNCNTTLATNIISYTTTMPEGDTIESIELRPDGSLLIPTGIKVKIPKNHILKFENKSGVASKKGLLIGACVIDEDYQGVVHINLWNVSDTFVVIKAGEKIAQAVLYPVALDNPEIVPIEELYTETTSRGEGGFGSTGTH
jgi:deoxyuridine 5'-triphosphate nucleotidohydrolase